MTNTDWMGPQDLADARADNEAQQRDHAVDLLRARVQELEGLINTPEMADFLEGVKREAAHQRERWGHAHDRDKSAENWFWLVGYLAGKALRAHIDSDREKAKHHTISSAAVLFQWHAAILRDGTGCGLGHDVDLDPEAPTATDSANG